MAKKLVNIVHKVCIPHTNHDSFDYLAGGLNPCIGARVWVPFRKKKRLGIIVGQGRRSECDALKLKTIEMIIDHDSLLCERMLYLCQWVSRYYQSPLSEVMPLFLPKNYRLGRESQLPLRSYYELIIPAHRACERLAPQARKQQALIECLSKRGALSKTCLRREGFGPAQLKPLLAQGIISLSTPIALPLSNKNPESPLTLNDEQAVAVKTITEHLHHYQCFLLGGITGSGKTEVYLQLIAKVLAQGQQVLILVPEIGLTPQLLARFQARFSEPIVIIHSNLNETERQNAWQLANDNVAKIVIGTRAAVFTPLPFLGLIVLDEEHDASFKQMEGVRYSARDTALMRASLAAIPIILGSATPSLESLYNCDRKKYILLRLTQKALTNKPLHYELIDIRNTRLQHGLAPKTLQTIAEHLEQGNQILVFINRRGFAPVLLCQQCGWMVDCHACDSHLTLHRQVGCLICHHCGIVKMIPRQCQKCQHAELVPIGAGTQRVHEYLQAQFPHTTLLRVDRDEVRKKNALDTHLDHINRGEARLIVGTQMLAKGHHFPRLTLVVILDTDAGFYNQDFRALERLGQLLIQVAGRAGRAQHHGQVLIQTHLPHHPLLKMLIQKGYDPFAQALLESRQQAELPPYHYLAVIRAQDRQLRKLLQFLHRIKEQLQTSGIKVFGPAPAPLARKAEQHRMQLLIKSSSRKVLQRTLTSLRAWLTRNKLTSNIRWNVDVDPVDLS